MNPMTTFASPAGQSVRVVDRAGEPWFVAVDVCLALDVRNPRKAVSRLDDDERDAVTLSDAIGRPQQMNTVSESGLYSLIMGSRKPEAKTFRRWVTHEVLPTIRKTGQYEAPNQAQMAVHPYFLEGLRIGREETLDILERFQGMRPRMGRPARTNVSRPAPTEKVGEDDAYPLPKMVEVIREAIPRFAGEQTTLAAIFDHFRIPRNRQNEMAISWILRKNGYERYHKMTNGIRTWVYRMAEQA